MNNAYLIANVVVGVAPNGTPADQLPQHDAVIQNVRDGVQFGDTWNGVSFVSRAIPAEYTNALAMEAQAEAALTQLRAYRDTASPNNAATVAIVKLICRVVIVLIRDKLRRYDGAD